jgi:hypothetical protein
MGDAVVVPDQAQRILHCRTWYEAPQRFKSIQRVPQGQHANAALNLVNGYKPDDPVGYAEIMTHPHLLPTGAGSAAASLAIQTFDNLNCANGIGRGGVTYGDIKRNFLNKMYYLGDKYHDVRVTGRIPFSRNNGNGADFARATHYQRNGFFAYLIAGELIGYQNIRHFNMPDLAAFQMPRLFGYVEAFADDLEECYYCFVLPMVHFLLELFNGQRISSVNGILQSPFKDLIRNWNVRGKYGIWSTQYCMERLNENPPTLNHRDAAITKGCFYPYARVLLTCTDRFLPDMDLLHLQGAAGGGERGTVDAGNEDIVIFAAGTVFPAGVPAGAVVIRSQVNRHIIVR